MLTAECYGSQSDPQLFCKHRCVCPQLRRFIQASLIVLQTNSYRKISILLITVTKILQKIFLSSKTYWRFGIVELKALPPKNTQLSLGETAITSDFCF